jgi:hypothetical protein
MILLIAASWVARITGVANNAGWLLFLKRIKSCQAVVAHAYNPSYSGGRDLEDLGSKSAQGR